MSAAARQLACDGKLIAGSEGNAPPRNGGGLLVACRLALRFSSAFNRGSDKRNDHKDEGGNQQDCMCAH